MKIQSYKINRAGAIILTLCLTAIAAIVTASSLGADKVEKGKGVEHIIKQLEDEWLNATIKGDYTIYDRVTAPEYTFTDSEGEMKTRSDLITEMKAGVYKCESGKNEEVKVRRYGDTAVVFLLETEKSTYKGEDSSGQYRFTDVFVKHDGHWQAVATHASRLKKK